MRDFLLFVHFVGLGLGLGTSFSFMRLGFAMKDTPIAERAPFMLKAFVLSKNGSIGFALLILSGLGLMFVSGPSAVMETGGVYFKAKLALVVVLAGLIGFMQTLQSRARRENGGPVMAKIPKFGALSQLTTLAIVLLAVLAFH